MKCMISLLIFVIIFICNSNIIPTVNAGKVNDKVSTSSLNSNLCRYSNNNNVLSTNITFPQRQGQYQQQVLMKKSPTAATTAKSKNPPRPHIVMALFDDLGANDLGSFSGGIQTPRTPFMDELMQGGIKLKQYYVQPICSPTRSALLTGRYPIRTGGQHGVALGNDATWIPADEVTLCERLVNLGYTCKGSGKWHLGHGEFKYSPAGRGFNDFFGAYHGGADHWEHIVWPGGGPHRDVMRRSQNNNGALKGMGRNIIGEAIDHKHDRFARDGTFIHEHITTDNMTHSSDAFTNQAIQMIWEHNVEKDGQLFLYLPYTAPHWPTQFYQQDADFNSHIPGQKRREFAGMITHLDRCIAKIVDVLKRKHMWSNTLFIGYGDNGGDITTGASNWPYRGTKTSPWEGGTRAAAFVYSLNPDIIPIAKRGTESYALAHVTDWYPTILSMVGVQAANLAVPGKPLDGVNMWESLVNGKYDPGNGQRSEMLYALDNIVGPEGEGPSLKRAANSWINVTALRIGDWKLIEGYPGRDDWYGEDPSNAWPLDYIVGPDFTDYNAIPKSIGGKVGDGGMRIWLESGKTDISQLKNRWLFNLAKDPTEQYDLQFQHPEVVEKLLNRMRQLMKEQVTPLQGLTVNYGGGGQSPALRPRRRTLPKDMKIILGDTNVEKLSPLEIPGLLRNNQGIVDLWDYKGLPAKSKILIDGIEIQEPASLADILADVQQQVQNQGRIGLFFNIFKSRLSMFFNGLFGGSPSTVQQSKL